MFSLNETQKSSFFFCFGECAEITIASETGAEREGRRAFIFNAASDVRCPFYVGLLKIPYRSEVDDLWNGIACHFCDVRIAHVQLNHRFRSAFVCSFRSSFWPRKLAHCRESMMLKAAAPASDCPPRNHSGPELATRNGMN